MWEVTVLVALAAAVVAIPFWVFKGQPWVDGQRDIRKKKGNAIQRDDASFLFRTVFHTNTAPHQVEEVPTYLLLVSQGLHAIAQGLGNRRQELEDLRGKKPTNDADADHFVHLQRQCVSEIGVKESHWNNVIAALTTLGFTIERAKWEEHASAPVSLSKPVGLSTGNQLDATG